MPQCDIGRVRAFAELSSMPLMPLNGLALCRGGASLLPGTHQG